MVLAIPYPEPGDIVVIAKDAIPIVHFLEGPYSEDQLPEVLRLFGDANMVCGQEFSWYYERLDGGGGIQGEGVVWHAECLN